MDIKAPLISIITICYNNKQGLINTCNSIWSQTDLQDIEFIIIDGNSTDGTKEFLLQNSSKITKYISEKDNGIYDAQNKGIKHANGRFLWFINSGDTIFNQNTIKHIKQNCNEKVQVIYGDTMYIDAYGNHLGLRSEITTKRIPLNLNKSSFRYGMTVGHQSILIEKSIAGLYDLQYHHVADIDWILNVLSKKPVCHKTEQPLSNFLTEGHSSKYRTKSNIERYKVLKKHFGFLPNLFNHIIIIFNALIFKLFKSN